MGGMSDPQYLARKEAARANRAFYQAFTSLDLEAMRAVWLDDPGVKCIHPGGEVLVGLPRVLASWEAIFRNTPSIRFELADLDVAIVGGLAWASATERIQQGPLDGPAAEAAVTNLFVLHEGRWRMILHHASPIARRFFA
jgi:ketosteroid isomerase-like protein